MSVQNSPKKPPNRLASNRPDLGLLSAVLFFLVLFVLLPNLGGCNGGDPDTTKVPRNAVEISFWTSDTKAEWVNTVTDAFNEAQHKMPDGRPIYVHVYELSSGDVFPKIQIGEIQPTVWSPGEISWVNEANVVWEDLKGQPLVSEECPPVAVTAIGIGMWQPMAEAMGWPDKPIGWNDIVDLAADPEGWARYGHPEWGRFKFGHTHPGSSNTGFLAMASLAYAAADATEGLTPEIVKSDQVVEAFQRVEDHTYHYGVSTRSLFTTMAERGPGYLHAATNSEIGVLATNYYQHDILRWPLVFIAPKEGTFWSDNPYCILDTDWVSEDQRQAAVIYRDFLLSRGSQETAIDEWLRPADASIPLRPPISLENGTNPEITPEDVPALESVSGQTAAAIKDVFFQTKKPASVTIVLDTSGSMGGTKLSSAVEGAKVFLGLLQKDDVVRAYEFNDQVRLLSSAGRVGDVGELLARELSELEASDKTNLYRAVCDAVQAASADQASDQAAGRRRLYGVIVLSDGLNTVDDMTESQMFECLPSGEAAEGVKIFTIAYGDDADEALLEEIAHRTNGLFYTSDPENISDVYLQISFEQ